MENGTATNALLTANQSITNYDYSFIFLFDNEYQSGDYTNDTYVDEVLPAGQVMGRISATGALVPMASGASDGSQYPVGITTTATDVAAGETVTINICVSGEVAEEKIILDGSDTLSTVVDSKQIRDRIASDTAGIILRTGTEMTAEDNQ